MLDNDHSPILCRYRFYTGGPLPTCGNLDCPLAHRQVMPADCAACRHQHPDDLKILTSEAMDIHGHAPLPEPPPDPPAPPPRPRPDLAAIALTLPAASPKDAERTFQRPLFHDDGSIEYPREEGSWEPPQNINGYVRDTDNKWLFHPLWLPCAFRHQMAFLKANCGCIDVVCRCNSPQSPVFGHRLAHTDCSSCPVRRE